MEQSLLPSSDSGSVRRVLIRVDGNETIGMGHLLRCLSLAQELRRKGDVAVEFVTQAHGVSGDAVRRAGFPVHSLPVEIPWEEEGRSLVKRITEGGTDLVITDLRWIDRDYLVALRDTGAVVSVIDEWGGKEIPADILINGTVVPAWHRYVTNGSVEVYLGPEYALLHPSFAQAHRMQRHLQEKGEDLLIALGGDDPFHLTLKTLRGLEKLTAPLEVTVVIGPAFVEVDRITQAAQGSRHRTTLLRNVENMAELMCQTDLAITGGGLTALEVACTGTPAIILCEVDHQVETADVLEEAGAAVNLGLGLDLPDDALAERVEALLADRKERDRLSRAGKKLIDGQGTQRVTEVLVRAMGSRSPR